LATRTISNAGGNWGSVGTWVEGAVPTNADNVVATASSGNVTIAAAAVCLSADFTGYTGTLTHNAFNWTIGNSGTSDAAFLKFSTGMTYTTSSSTSCKVTLNSRYNTCNITSNGKTIRNLSISNNLGLFGLVDQLRVTDTFLVTNSTFDFSNQNANVGVCNFASGSIILGSGTITCTTFSNNSASTISQDTSTVNVTGGGFIAMGFSSFHNLNISGNVSVIDSVIYDGSMTIAGGSVLSFLPPDGAFTFNNNSSIAINGSLGNLVEFKSSTPGSQTGITGNGSDTYDFSYMKITDSFANNGTFNARNSTNGGNNTGWNFISGLAAKKTLLGVGY